MYANLTVSFLWSVWALKEDNKADGTALWIQAPMAPVAGPVVHSDEGSSRSGRT